MQTSGSSSVSGVVVEKNFPEKNLYKKISNLLTRTIQCIATTLIIALGLVLMGCAIYTIAKTCAGLVKFAVKNNPLSQKGISNSRFLLDCLGDLIVNIPIFLIGRKIYKFGREG
ncbi:MAG: hypothetical protein FJZ60_04220 [Chlamydiae bacterium]|nr:hypothetical protein [Chlamydiota bacterium]